MKHVVEMMNPETEVTKPITVICYEADKPRLISPDSFFIYGGRIKYKHLEAYVKDGKTVYKLLLPDIPLEIFEIVYQAFKIEKRSLTMDHIDEVNNSDGKRNPYNINNNRYKPMPNKLLKTVPDAQLLEQYTQIVNIAKMSKLMKHDVANFVEQYNIPLPRFCFIGKLTYDDVKDQYDNITYMIFDESAYEIQKSYHVVGQEQYNINVPDNVSVDLEFLKGIVPELHNIDPNTIFLNADDRGLQRILYYNLDFVPDYIYLYIFINDKL
jgi:hypothetical protein